MQTALIPHLLRKDLRHVRVLFGLWVFLLLTQGLLIGSGFISTSDNFAQFVWQIAYVILTVGLPLLQALVVIVLLPWLIQEEPLAGTTAFWFTRPIERSTLFVAKAVFVVGFLVIPPLVVEVLVLFANGIETADILRTMPEVLFGSLSLIVPVSAIAVLTRSFAKFALWLIVSWIVLALFGALVYLVRLITAPEQFLQASQMMSLTLSQSIAGGICTLIGGVILIIHQYLTRNTRLSVFILAVTMVTTMAVQSLWKVDFLKRPEPPASQETFPIDTVGVALKPGTIFANAALQISPAQGPSTNLNARFEFTSVPEGYQVEITRAQSEMIYSDSTVVKSGSTLVSEVMRNWWPAPLQHALGGIPVRNAEAGPDNSFAKFFSMKTSVYQARKTQPGTLVSTLTLTAHHLRVIGRVPLRPSERLKDGSQHVEIGAVLEQTGGCRVLLRERKLNLWTTRSVESFGPQRSPADLYLLVNPVRREAVLPEPNLDFNMASQLLQASTRLINRTIPVEFRGDLNNKTVVTITPEWLADAELVWIRAVPAGTLQRSLKVENLLLTDQ